MTYPEKKPSAAKALLLFVLKYAFVFLLGFGTAINMVWTGKFDAYRDGINGFLHHIEKSTDNVLSPLAAARLKPPAGARLIPSPATDPALTSPAGDSDSGTKDGNSNVALWEIPFWVDTSSAPSSVGKEKSVLSIKQAAESWAGCGAKFVYKGEKQKSKYGDYGPGQNPSTEEPIVAWMPLEGTTAGTTWRSEQKGADGKGQVVGWTMELDPKATGTERDMIAVAAHEFGHAFGMDHARDKTSIMYGIENPDVYKPNKDDIVECRRILEGWKKNVAESSGMAKKKDS